MISDHQKTKYLDHPAILHTVIFLFILEDKPDGQYWNPAPQQRPIPPPIQQQPITRDPNVRKC